MDWEDVIKYALGAGGLATIIGGLTKYLLNKRRLTNSHDMDMGNVGTLFVKDQLDRQSKRIDELEKSYDNCIRGEAERERKIGGLQTEIDILKRSMSELRNQDMKQATNLAADRAAVKAVEQVVEKVADRVIEKGKEGS